MTDNDKITEAVRNDRDAWKRVAAEYRNDWFAATDTLHAIGQRLGIDGTVDADTVAAKVGDLQASEGQLQRDPVQRELDEARHKADLYRAAWEATEQALRAANRHAARVELAYQSARKRAAETRRLADDHGRNADHYMRKAAKADAKARDLQRLDDARMWKYAAEKMRDVAAEFDPFNAGYLKSRADAIERDDA